DKDQTFPPARAPGHTPQHNARNADRSAAHHNQSLRTRRILHPQLTHRRNRCISLFVFLSRSGAFIVPDKALMGSGVIVMACIPLTAAAEERAEYLAERGGI